MEYIEDIVDKNIDITESVIKNLHYIILKTINNENAGRYRNVNVLISGSKHRPPEHFLVPQKMQGLIKWYDENKSKLYPIKLAAEFHHKFTLIHPFIDENDRCGRLLMNLILMRCGYPITVIRMEDRNEYMSALEKASVENNLEDFMGIVAAAVNRSLDTYLYCELKTP